MRHCGRMPMHPHPLPPVLGGQFTVHDAVAKGASRRRMRARDLTAPFIGVRRSAEFTRQRAEIDEDDPAPDAAFRRARRRLFDDARAYAMVMSEGSFFCGRTAAAFGGLPVSTPQLLDVAVIAPHRAPRAKGVRGRKVEGHLVAVTTFEGLPVTSPVATWAMLGQELSVRELVQVGDALVQIPRDDFGRQHPDRALATLNDLAEATAMSPRRPGARELRAALELIEVGSSSPLETDYRVGAAEAGLPTPELDVEIFDENRRRLGISEFFYRDYRVVVEVEGDQHRTSKRQWNRDIEKYQDYAGAGIEVVRLTSKHVRGPYPTGFDVVAAALRRHGWTG